MLLILQQLTRDARLDEQADGAGTTLAWKAQKLIRTQYHRPLSTVHRQVVSGLNEAQLMRDFVADGGSLIGLVKKHCEIWAGD